MSTKISGTKERDCRALQLATYDLKKRARAAESLLDGIASVCRLNVLSPNEVEEMIKVGCEGVVGKALMADQILDLMRVRPTVAGLDV